MSDNPRTGLSLSMVLLVIFIVLKLTDNVTWSWVWVLAPLWIPMALLLPVLGVMLFASAFTERGRQRRAGLR